jgi:hypothetical protein
MKNQESLHWVSIREKSIQYFLELGFKKFEKFSKILEDNFRIKKLFSKIQILIRNLEIEENPKNGSFD